MLREGIARAKASLRLRDEDRERDAAAAGKGAKRSRRKREETEAKRLLGLDLGDDSGFAALAEKCLELREGVSERETITFSRPERGEISSREGGREGGDGSMVRRNKVLRQHRSEPLWCFPVSPSGACRV